MAQQDPPDPLEYELQEGRAIALGKAGKKLEAALAALAEGRGERDQLLDGAADAVWGWLIVRESLAFYDHAVALAYFHVPAQVMARVGVYRPK